MFRLRRCLLFTPGDDPLKIGKAAGSGADSVVLDLEDAVAPTHKQMSRTIATDALRDQSFGRSERLVRVNSPATDLFADDLKTTIQSGPDGYVIPKVETPEQLEFLDFFLAKEEARQGRPKGATQVLALIETAKGLLNLKQIASSCDRLAALLLGAEDLATDIGAKRSDQGWEILYARSFIITVAAAYKLQPIDAVFVEFHDLDGLASECSLVQGMGFEGKLAIHPSQVEVIQRVFTPSRREIEAAQQIIHEYALQASNGIGVVGVGGKMVDLPMVQAAENLLRKAKAAGLLG